MGKGLVAADINTVRWQDFRGMNSGIVLFYESDSVAALPIREIPESLPSDVVPEPNYETMSFGYFGCKSSKVRNAIAKKKHRYIFLMTKYVGSEIDFTDEFYITGYYRIKQTADVLKVHMRYLNEYSCLGEDKCIAFRADDGAFVKIEDAMKVTPQLLAKWGVSTRITRQSRMELSDETTAELIAYLKSKPNAIAEYIEETKHLSPVIEEDEDE